MGKESIMRLQKALKKLSIKTLSFKMWEKLMLERMSPMSPPRVPTLRDDQVIIRKGCFAVYVGREEAKRYVIPLSYLKHPVFLQLLKKAEEEFGFGSTGCGLQIPCDTAVFDWLLLLISREHETLNGDMMEELLDMCM